MLIIVSSLISISSLYGNERVRQAQEELRKRHLFFGELNGEPSPALTAAIGHYQLKKGFAFTGRLDPETCGSLHISPPLVPPANVSFVLVNSGEARDANGEAVPRSLVLAVSKEDRTNEFDQVLTERGPLGLTLPVAEEKRIPPEASDSKGRSRSRTHRIGPPKAKNPFVMAFQSVDQAMKRWLGDAGPARKKTVASKRP